MSRHKRKKAEKQVGIEFLIGGKTEAARKRGGRKKGPNPKVAHVRRDEIPPNTPCEVTVKIRKGLPRLRTARFNRAFRGTLIECCMREGFRVVKYTIQKNHFHFVIEADSKRCLSNGMASLGARIAHCVHRVFDVEGEVLHGRYHVRQLKTPYEVKNALRYVLLNARKHFMQEFGHPPPVRIDECSSGAWFDGWTCGVDPPDRPREVAEPTCWLLRVGWRRHGLIDPAEVPGFR